MSMSTGQSGYASQTYGTPAQPVTPTEWPAQNPHAAPELAAPSIGRRVGAYAIDAAILGVIGVVTVVIVLLVVQGELVAAITEPRPIALWTIPVLMIPAVVSLAIALAYSAMQGAGGSIGQRAVGIRVVHADTGAPLGFWRAVWRNIVWGAACAIIVGYFSPLFGAAPQRRGWHDLASGAVVTERGAAGGASASTPAAQAADRPVAAEPPRPHSPAPAAPADAFASLPAAGPADPFSSPLVAAPADPFASPQQPAPIDPFAVPAPPAPPAPPASAAPPVPRPPAAPASEPAAAPDEGSAPDQGSPIAFVPGVTGERDEQPQVEPAAPVVPPVPRTDAPPAVSPGSAPAMPIPPALPAPEPVAEAPSTAPPAPVSEVPAAPAMPAVDDAPAAPAPAPAAPEFPDDTIVLNQAPAPTEVATVVLVWDDGTRTDVTSRTVFGRNPVATDGADTVAIIDDTLSLSKTHFEIAIDDEAASIVDLHSTNGVVVVRGGTSTTLVPDRAAPLAAGDRVTIGERTVSIERAGKR